MHTTTCPRYIADEDTDVISKTSSKVLNQHLFKPGTQVPSRGFATMVVGDKKKFLVPSLI